MDFKNGTRWGLGTRGVRTPGLEESQRLLLDADDQSDDYANSSRSKGKQNKVSKVRKAKIEDSYSEDDEGNLIPLGGSSRPPRPLPVPDQCIEVSIGGTFICLWLELENFQNLTLLLMMSKIIF